MKKTFLIILILVGGAISAARQQDADIKFRLAQGHERSGNYEAAIRLYEELYRKDTTGFPVFDALRRAYLQVKQYDKAIALVNRRLATTPKDVGLLAQLGTMHTRAGDESQAVSAWDRAMAVDAKNENNYRIVASAMIESRLFERAIATYRHGREAIGKPTLYSSDLAYLHAIMLNYTDATREYLAMMREAPGQLSYVQSRIGTYTDRPEGLASATTVVEQASSGSPEDLPTRRLLSWLYMEGKKFDEAYTVVTRIDELARSNGQELFVFAERALHDRAYPVSSKAYSDIISRYPKFPLMPQVKFGYARSLEESSAAPDGPAGIRGGQTTLQDSTSPVSEFGQGLPQVLAAYAGVVREYPGTDVAGQSLLRTAAIHFDRLFNLDEALASLQNIGATYARYPAIVLEARVLTGEILIAQGDLDGAEAAFSEVVASRASTKDVRERAAYRRAELLYFKGSFKETLQQLDDLTKDAGANITNDALDLQIFIKDNMETAGAALKKFASGDLLRRQRKQSEALEVYAAILKDKKAPDLNDEALMSSGEIYADLGKYSEALSAFERLSKEYPESINLDRAQMRTALIYESGIHDRDRAIAAYQALLEKYPNSILVSEARKRIRALRGDTL